MLRLQDAGKARPSGCIIAATRRAEPPHGASPCRTLGVVAIMPSWSPNLLFIWGIKDQLGLIAADDTKRNYNSR
jgi:hypothetical protein